MKKHIILFDGVCNFCNGAVNFVIDRDAQKKFAFASLQSETGKALLKQYKLQTLNLDTVVLIKEDKVYHKSGAVLEISKHLSGLWPALLVFRIIPSSIRDLLYDTFARNRYRLFGRSDSCRMPTPDLKARFLA